jgi:glycosyltransferase involved in cell wall biosynthesis
MRILVLFPNLNRIGGAEFLCFSAIKALLEDKNDVTLLTTQRTDWRALVRSWGSIEGGRIDEISIQRYRTSAIYETLIDSEIIERKKERLCPRYDLTINFHANYLPVSADICYIHYPSGPAIYWRIPSSMTVRDIKYTNSLPWKIYYQPFRILFNKLSYRATRRAKILLATGRFTSDLIGRFYGQTPIILPPSIPLEQGKTYVQTKRPMVLTISRFVEHKQPYSLVEVAKHFLDIDFYIIASVDLRRPPAYYLKFTKDLSKLNLRNLHLILNATEETKIELLSKTLIYVHPATYETFGISVLEAMRAGAVVIVRKTSGAWLDIVSEGRYGFGFSTQAELESLLAKIVPDKETLSRYSKISIERAQHFSYESFKNQLLSLIRFRDKK